MEYGVRLLQSDRRPRIGDRFPSSQFPSAPLPQAHALRAILLILGELSVSAVNTNSDRFGIVHRGGAEDAEKNYRAKAPRAQRKISSSLSELDGLCVFARDNLTWSFLKKNTPNSVNSASLW
jgi:hypothetical protein